MAHPRVELANLRLTDRQAAALKTAGYRRLEELKNMDAKMIAGIPGVSKELAEYLVSELALMSTADR